MDRNDKIKRVINIIAGALLCLIGCLLTAAPLITLTAAVNYAGLILIFVGALSICGNLFFKSKEALYLPLDDPQASVLVLVLGIVLFVWREESYRHIPWVAAVWFYAFAAVYFVKSFNLYRCAGAYKAPLALGVLAAVGGVLLLLVGKLYAEEMTGVFLGGLSMIYGFLILMDALIKTRKKTEKEILEEDKEISGAENAGFYEFERELKDGNKGKSAKK